MHDSTAWSCCEGTGWAAEKFPQTWHWGKNQLWFPVTSLVQYVHVEQCESKGGHGEREIAAGGFRNSFSFAETDDAWFVFHCDRSRDTETWTWCESDASTDFRGLWDKIKSISSLFLCFQPEPQASLCGCRMVWRDQFLSHFRDMETGNNIL